MIEQSMHVDEAAGQLLSTLAGRFEMPELSEAAMANVLLHARKSLLLGSLSKLWQQRYPTHEMLPALKAGEQIASVYQRMLVGELFHLRRCFDGSGLLPVLLKGAAYHALKLPLANGRMVSDVDLLVSKQDLPLAEKLLRDAGFIAADMDEYDQRYYRQWMHEIPPMRHSQRLTVVDLHHTILPPTGRVQPNIERMLADARPVDGLPFKTLSPPDMVLHSAAHTFQDGDLNNRLRDLYDFDQLLRWACPDAQSAQGLLERAQLHQLDRPLSYALRYANAWLDTPFAGIAPKLPTVNAWMMDRLLPAAICPTVLGPEPARPRLARKALYIRSHWLRMPPLQLAGHLLHKKFKTKNDNP